MPVTWSTARRTATSAWVRLRWLCLAGAAGRIVVDDAMPGTMDGGAQAWWLPGWPCQSGRNHG